MIKMGSKVIWIAGGSAAFAAAFLGVSIVRGAALREIPPFRWFAGPAPAGEPAAASAPNLAPGPSSPPVASPPTAHSAPPAVSSMTAGVLGAFVMPSPYDARELHQLDQRLRSELARVAAEEERLKRRELELGDWQNLLQQRAQDLATLRASLEGAGAHGETDARPQGKESRANSAASWRSLAPLFEEGDASEVADRLGQLEPDEAAQVLRALGPERSAELLNALPKDRYKAFLDAWRRAEG